MIEWLGLVLLGFATGFLGVLAGVGGGFILTPTLIIFVGLEPQVAVGTSLALVAINSIPGTLAYLRMGLVDRRSGLLFAATAIPGSIIGPFVLRATPGDAFKVVFGLLLIGVAVMTILNSRTRSETTVERPRFKQGVARRRITDSSGQVYEYQVNERLAGGFNTLLGFVSSYFGTGGAFLRTPALVSFFGFPILVAVGTSLFAITIYGTAGAITHAALRHVDWYPTFAWAVIGVVAGGHLGARLAPHMRPLWVLGLLAALLVSMGIRLAAEGFRG